MIDFVMSENSMGFHAPQEATRILGDAINFCRLGQLSLHDGPPPSHNPPNIENITSETGPAESPIKPAKEKEKFATGFNSASPTRRREKAPGIRIPRKPLNAKLSVSGLRSGAKPGDVN
jgi:hypothetical protein